MKTSFLLFTLLLSFSLFEVESNKTSDRTIYDDIFDGVSPTHNLRGTPSLEMNNHDETNKHLLDDSPNELFLKVQDGEDEADIVIDYSDPDSFSEKHRQLSRSWCQVFSTFDGGHYWRIPKESDRKLQNSWWNDRITHVRTSSTSTCIYLWENKSGGRSYRHCGVNWKPLGSWANKASRLKCT